MCYYLTVLVYTKTTIHLSSVGHGQRRIFTSPQATPTLVNSC